MAKSEVLINKDGEEDAENLEDKTEREEMEKSAKALMGNGFLLIFLNKLFGFLPVTVSENHLTHAKCSIATLYSLILLLVMIFFSYHYSPTSFMTFKMPVGATTQPGIADVIAIIILRGAHVVGFIILAIRGLLAAKHVPSIWNSLVKCFQLSISTEKGEKYCKKIKKLERFANWSVIVYVIVLMGSVLPKNLVSKEHLIFSFFKRFPIRTPWQLDIIMTGYIIWDFISFSHILVSIFLNYLLLTTVLCLRSANDRLRILLESDIKDITDMDDARGTKESRRITDELKNITEVYSLAQSVTGSLSSAFGISLIVEVLILLGNTLVNLFFIICLLLWDRNTTLMSYDDLYVLVSICLFNFIFFYHLAGSATKLVNECRKPLSLLRGIQYNFKYPPLKEKFAAFKTDLVNSTASLSATSYFQVDKRLMATLIGAVTTYIVVMLQFKQQQFGPQ